MDGRTASPVLRRAHSCGGKVRLLRNRQGKLTIEDAYRKRSHQKQEVQEHRKQRAKPNNGHATNGHDPSARSRVDRVLEIIPLADKQRMVEAWLKAEVA